MTQHITVGYNTDKIRLSFFVGRVDYRHMTNTVSLHKIQARLYRMSHRQSLDLRIHNVRGHTHRLEKYILFSADPLDQIDQPRTSFCHYNPFGP